MKATTRYIFRLEVGMIKVIAVWFSYSDIKVLEKRSLPRPQLNKVTGWKMRSYDATRIFYGHEMKDSPK
jgi:hypothetical protein